MGRATCAWWRGPGGTAMPPPGRVPQERSVRDCKRYGQSLARAGKGRRTTKTKTTLVFCCVGRMRQVKPFVLNMLCELALHGSTQPRLLTRH